MTREPKPWRKKVWRLASAPWPRNADVDELEYVKRAPRSKNVCRARERREIPRSEQEEHASPSTQVFPSQRCSKTINHAADGFQVKQTPVCHHTVSLFLFFFLIDCVGISAVCRRKKKKNQTGLSGWRKWNRWMKTAALNGQKKMSPGWR